MVSASPLPATVRAAERLGERVYSRRRELGLTQQALAEQIGLSRNQIQNVEKSRNNRPDGTGNAQLDTVFRLADGLGVTVIYLLSEDDRSQ